MKWTVRITKKVSKAIPGLPVEVTYVGAYEKAPY